MDDLINKLPSVQGSSGQELYLSTELKAVVNVAEKKRSKMGDEYTSVEHIFPGIIAEGSSDIKSILKAGNISENTLNDAIEAIRGSQNVTDQEFLLLITLSRSVLLIPDFRSADGLSRCRYPVTLNYYNTMGDKSPKSKQKDKNQKASKTAADAKKKKSDSDSKEQPKPGDSKKKKKK
ncbi:MAG: Clp protease N-terminal domain-containing protein [Verrucomicrobiales bacterium]|nr:Clp protease N-terminal domain-containing protein [Verrucomicrobiales bacterium]